MATRNQRRQKRVSDILNAYGIATGDPHADAQTLVTDLLADLMHFCGNKRSKVDFEEALESARGHYGAERHGEYAPQQPGAVQG